MSGLPFCSALKPADMLKSERRPAAIATVLMQKVVAVETWYWAQSFRAALLRSKCCSLEENPRKGVRTRQDSATPAGGNNLTMRRIFAASSSFFPLASWFARNDYFA